MPQPVSNDRIIIRFDLKEAIDLDEMAEGFSALSRQYRKMLATRGFSEKEVPTRLLVTRLESGSLETEIAAYGVLAWGVISTIDAALILADFSIRIKSVVGYFAGRNKRPKSLDRDDITDFETFIKPIAGRRRSKLSVKTATYHERSETREIHAAYEFGEKDLSGAFVNMGRELEEESGKTRPEHKIEKNVALSWAQTNWIEVKSKGRTGDRGIIERISDRPLPVYFPTEESTIKYKMTSGDFNPSKIAYIVDVDVQSVQGEPVAYTVMKLHDIVPLDGNGDYS